MTGSSGVPPTAGLRATRPPTGGFALVEVMIAIGLLAVAAVTIVGLFSALTKVGQGSNNQTMALYLARDKLARLVRSNAFIPFLTESDTPPNMPQGWVREWWGTQDTLDPVHVEIVTVRVRWTEGIRSRDVSLEGVVVP